MAPVANGTEPQQNGIHTEFPDWVNTLQIENAVRANVGAFNRIISTYTVNGSSQGENYSSLMLRLTVEVEMKDGSIKTTTFVLKAQHSNDAIASILSMLQLFPKEEQMYHRILPKFEELYKNAGKEVQFAPRAYTFDRKIDVDYILLEDLKQKNFKNANRIQGFDMEHMQQVLIKLAEFHAASACYVEHFGSFGTEFTVGVFSESNRALLKEFNGSAAFLKHLKNWKNCRQYYDKLADSDDYLVDRLLEQQKNKPHEFNVLNHGDCWANNIMFQYDATGNVKDTLFIDFQVGKYGTPAVDLYYLILSSAAHDIKLTQFDYMIRFYYENLVENLKFLQYHRPLPKLKSLHMTLLNHGLAAYMVVSKVLPVVMLEKPDGAQLENYMEDESKMKTAMFTNHKYVKAMADIMPWLDHRGLLDFK